MKAALTQYGLRCLVALALGVAAICALPAQEPTTTRETLLVLRTGKVMRGRIGRNAGGYVVTLINGSIFVPEEQVQFQALDLDDALVQLEGTLPAGKASTHVTLAQWCLANRMYPSAQDQLRSALEIAPNDLVARRMLKQLEQLLDPGADETPTPAAPARTIAGAFVEQETESLGRLSRETAETYVTRVQPLLMNRCITSGCHGPKVDNDFRLSHVRTGSHATRLLSEQNLAVTLKFIDRAHPGSSLLLKRAGDHHAGPGTSLHDGSRGGDQFKTLEEWIERVAAERPAVIETAKNLAPTRAPLTHSTVEYARPSAVVTAAGTDPWQVPAAGKEDIVERVLREERDDPFDPDAFNRLYFDDVPN